MLKIASRPPVLPLLLAPMAGLTHSALRVILVRLGGVGLLSTEMLSARRLPVENPVLSPYLLRTEAEHPLVYQLLVTDESEVAPAITALHRLGADGVDLNLGCPAPRVRQAGGGSALMAEPERVKRIVARARRETDLPLSVKIRLGKELNERELVGFCRMLEAEGVDLLTVHARLQGEPFSRRPRWEWVGRVKRALAIPVVANGGIFSVADARRCLEDSGADGLMIGRAAAEKPWLFNRIAREIYGAALEEAPDDPVAVYCAFVRELLRFPPERRLGRLKEFTHYLARNYAFGHHLAMGVQSSATLDQAWTRARAFFERTDPERAERAGLDEVSGLLAAEVPPPSDPGRD